MKSQEIVFQIDENDAASLLADMVSSGNVNIEKCIENILEKCIIRDIEKQLSKHLTKPPTVLFTNNKYHNYRFNTLMTLAKNGFKINYIQIKFITKPEDTIDNTTIESHGFSIENWGMNFFQAKKLKKQSNHLILLREVFLPASIFLLTINKIKILDKIEQRYIANFEAGFHYRYALVSFDDILTNDRFFCACSKQALKIIFDEINELAPRYSKESWLHQLIHILQNAKYKSDLCHLCIAKKYGHTCALQRYGDSIHHYYKVYAYQLLQTSTLDIKTLNADVMQQLGISKWIRESELYRIIKELFNEYQIFREASPQWLGRLRLDIYIPEVKLAIEHQGQQHYEPIDMFGGDTSFKSVIERDNQKSRLCKENGVTLILVKYNEALTSQHIRNRLKKFLRK